MKILQILTDITEPVKYKVHLAIGGEYKFTPLNAFWEGKFKEWQEEQNQKNFERQFIFSLIYYDINQWLFAGIYERVDVKQQANFFKYNTRLMSIHEELIGRLIIKFEKKFRQSYVLLENHCDKFMLGEILKDRSSVQKFPGYENVRLNFQTLSTIINENEISWKTALQNAKGVYLIADKNTGKQYVGSAYGIEAIWSRWQAYVKTGHGNNSELKKLLRKKGDDYKNNFQFSILEARTQITSDEEIIERENHWKNILLTREFGYNKN